MMRYLMAYRQPLIVMAVARPSGPKQRRPRDIKTPASFSIQDNTAEKVVELRTRLIGVRATDAQADLAVSHFAPYFMFLEPNPRVAETLEKLNLDMAKVESNITKLESNMAKVELEVAKLKSDMVTAEGKVDVKLEKLAANIVTEAKQDMDKKLDEKLRSFSMQLMLAVAVIVLASKTSGDGWLPVLLGLLTK